MGNEVPRYPGGVDLNWIKNVSIAEVAAWLGRDVVRGKDYPTDEQIQQAKQEREEHTVFESTRHDK